MIGTPFLITKNNMYKRLYMLFFVITFLTLFISNGDHNLYYIQATPEIFFG